MTKILIRIDPEFQRVVPVEPTDEMICAAMDAEDAKPLSDWGKVVQITYEETYAAMLAATLQPEPVDAIANFLHQFKRHVGGDGEFWLHELEDFYDAISQGELK